VHQRKGLSLDTWLSGHLIPFEQQEIMNQLHLCLCVG